MKLKSATSLAGVLLVFSGVSALARPAVTTTDSNLRRGPGIESPVVGVLRAGAPIDVGRCAGNWCRVNGAGYLARALIAFGGARGSGVATVVPATPDGFSYGDPGYAYGYGPDDGYDYGPGYAYDDYGYDPGVSLGFYGGSYVGGGWRGHRRGGPFAGNPGRNLGGGVDRGAVAADPGSLGRGLKGGGAPTMRASASAGGGLHSAGGFRSGAGHPHH